MNPQSKPQEITPKPISKNAFIKLMMRNGVQWGSQREHDYIKAKRLIEANSLDPGDYERLIRITTDYIQI